MRIAIAGIRGIPGRYSGFETSAEETATRMQQLGHQVTVYCRAKQGEQGQSEYAGVKLVYLRVVPVSSLETIFHSIAVGLHVAFCARDVDVVHMYNAASAFGGLIVRIAGKPLIMTLDGVEWEREKWGPIARVVWKISTWLAVKVANATVCDSRTVKTLFDKQFGANCQYIPYGAKRIDSVSKCYELFGLERQKYFIFVGRLVPEKGVDILLDAYSLVDTDTPLVIVGDNEHDADYVAMLRRKAGANVKFLGFRYGEEYESLLANARAYITASKLEGTSPSLLAAMGAHVCCLVRAIPENIETGGDAILYFDGTIRDLAEKWRMISEDTETLNKYASKGFERVTAQYDWDGQIKRGERRPVSAALDSADRQEPSPARTTKATRLNEKIAKLKKEMQRLEGGSRHGMLATPGPSGIRSVVARCPLDGDQRPGLGCGGLQRAGGRGCQRSLFGRRALRLAINVGARPVATRPCGQADEEHAGYRKPRCRCRPGLLQQRRDPGLRGGGHNSHAAKADDLGFQGRWALRQAGLPLRGRGGCLYLSGR